MYWVHFIAFFSLYNKTEIDECCLSFMNAHKDTSVCVHKHVPFSGGALCVCKLPVPGRNSTCCYCTALCGLLVFTGIMSLIFTMFWKHRVRRERFPVGAATGEPPRAQRAPATGSRWHRRSQQDALQTAFYVLKRRR